MNKTFLASIDALYDMLAFVSRLSMQAGFSSSNLSKIELATEEVLVNIINYGYPNGDGTIEISCEVLYSPVVENAHLTDIGHGDQEGIKIVIKDNGHSYNPLTYQTEFDPTAPLERRQIGGYGIFFMTTIMDTVRYSRNKDQNILTLIKYHPKVENHSLEALS